VVVKAGSTASILEATKSCKPAFDLIGIGETSRGQQSAIPQYQEGLVIELPRQPDGLELRRLGKFAGWISHGLRSSSIRREREGSLCRWCPVTVANDIHDMAFNDVSARRRATEPHPSDHVGAPLCCAFPIWTAALDWVRSLPRNQREQLAGAELLVERAASRGGGYAATARSWTQFRIRGGTRTLSQDKGSMPANGS
jgi:hypothetical protein